VLRLGAAGAHTLSVGKLSQLKMIFIRGLDQRFKVEQQTKPAISLALLRFGDLVVPQGTRWLWIANARKGAALWPPQGVSP
jgi:hypothetical protein